VPIFKPDPAKSQQIQSEKLRKFREKRDKVKHAEAMKRLVDACNSDENAYPYTFEALKAGATFGEVMKAQLDAYGGMALPGRAINEDYDMNKRKVKILMVKAGLEGHWAGLSRGQQCA